MKLDPVHGNAAEPRGDDPLAYMRSLLFYPDLRIFPIPPYDPAWPFRADPRMKAPPRRELYDRVRLVKTFLHVTQFFNIAPAFVVQVAVRIEFGVRERAAWFKRFFHVKHEWPFLPLYLDQSQRLASDLFRVRCHGGPHFFALEMGYPRQNRSVRRAVTTEFRECRQFRVIVPEDVPDTRKPLSLGRVHTPDPRVSVGRGQEAHAEHAGKLHIYSVDRFATRLLIPVDAAHATLTDVSVCPRGYRSALDLIHLLQYHLRFDFSFSIHP